MISSHHIRKISAYVVFCLLTLLPVCGKAAEKESAYDRVLRTGTLRCAYGTWEPYVMRDPNTGKMSGIVYDFMQEVGKALNLKVEYNLEVSWDSIATALQTGKADAHCAGAFATPARGRSLAFSDPLFFSPAAAFARKDDARFDNDISRIDRPDVTIAVTDDDLITELRQHDFPQAKTFEVPAAAGLGELLRAVATKKADVAFSSPATFKTFEKENPGQLKIIPTAEPLRLYASVIAVSIHEEALARMLNAAIDNLTDDGVADKLIAKYKTQYDVNYLVPVNRPYKLKSGGTRDAIK